MFIANTVSSEATLPEEDYEKLEQRFDTQVQMYACEHNESLEDGVQHVLKEYRSLDGVDALEKMQAKKDQIKQAMRKAEAKWEDEEEKKKYPATYLAEQL